MAGTLKVKNVQLGDNVTATQNFVWSENSDGTAKLARGNVGATTQDILTVNAAGKVTITTVDVTTLSVTTLNATTLSVANTAWGALTANAASNPTLNASSNIAGVTRTGTGTYQVTFTTAMPNTNYRVMTQHGQLGIALYVTSIAVGGFSIIAYATTTAVVSDIASTVRFAFTVEG